jgi:uncharacterized protein (DUF433 family)
MLAVRVSLELTPNSRKGERRVTNLIKSDPAVMMGKPVVAGTRITVELVLEKLAAGETIDEVLDAHPRLTRESVLAALDFGNRAAK